MDRPDAPPAADPGVPERGPLGELARLFLKLGVIAFGGPAAHVAMLEDEVVERRRWMSRQHFLDLVGATNLVPGPNSTEMTMHVGYERAGWRGLFVAGACFIGPAVLMTGALGGLYVAYGQVPEAERWLYGIAPAVLAVIGGALWKLGKKAVTGWKLAVLALAVAAAVLAGVGEVWALLVGGVLGAAALKATGHGSETAARWLPILLLKQTAAGAGAAAAAGAVASVSLGKLFWFFLKVGSVLYGSGYVLVAFLEGGLVDDYGWLTQAQLLDAIAIGQFTPGPVLSTATFIGVVVGAEVSAPVAGAALATLGIFLPSFLFVWVLNPLIPRLRQSAWLSAFLDAVNAAAVALMAAVTVELVADTVFAGGAVSWPALAIAALAAVAVLRFKLSSVWVVVGGAALGAVLYPFA